MAKSADKPTIKLRLRLVDRESSREEFAEATRNVRQQLLELDVDDVEPEPSRDIPRGAKVVEPFSLGLLGLKLVASGGALTGAIAVLRSWVQGRTNRTVTVRYGKDALTLKGASSKQQEKLIAEWITQISKREPASSKAKPRRLSKKVAKQTRSARR